MAETKGRIDNITILDGFCCLRVLEEEDGGASVLLLWSYSTQQDNASNRLLHGQYLTLVRDALVNNRVVTFGHEDDSALVDWVVLE